MSNFTYHKVSDEEKDKIREESKHLLEKFRSKLGKISAKESHFSNDHKGTREESDGWKTDQDFKDITMLNAPFTEDDHIVAEKGGWKKK